MEYSLTTLIGERESVSWVKKKENGFFEFGLRGSRSMGGKLKKGKGLVRNLWEIPNVLSEKGIKPALLNKR